jgi:hypothetical protein
MEVPASKPILYPRTIPVLLNYPRDAADTRGMPRKEFLIHNL